MYSVNCINSHMFEFLSFPPKKPRGARAIKKLDEKRKSWYIVVYSLHNQCTVHIIITINCKNKKHTRTTYPSNHDVPNITHPHTRRQYRGGLLVVADPWYPGSFFVFVPSEDDHGSDYNASDDRDDGLCRSRYPRGALWWPRRQ